jgi:DHA2 family multidrug resistance protein-like MFS transporter
MATLTLIGPSTEYPQVGVALLIIGIGLGMAFTAASDLILASVPPERAGAAAGVSETGYELGTALGIAVLGSIIAGVYRGFGIPPGLPDEVATHAKDSLPGAFEAAMHIPEDKAVEMLSAAREAFADGLAIAAGVGSVLLLASACAIWLLLKSKPPQLPSTPDATREDMTPPVPPA